MFFTKEQLLSRARLRKSGYVDAVLSKSVEISHDNFEIKDDVLSGIVKEYKMTKLVLTKKDFQKKCENKGQGYCKEIIAASIESDSGYEIDIHLYDTIEKKYRNPNMIEMIKNAGNAALEAINSGLDVRGKEDTEKALSICSNCPRLIIDQFRCGACGCFLSYKVKLKAWHCPLNKW